MVDGLKQVAPSTLPRFQLITADFTKLDQLDFYSKLQHLLDNKATESEICAQLAKSEDSLRKLDALPHLKGKFPLVISSAVYTQIFYMQALSLFAGHIERYTQEELYGSFILCNFSEHSDYVL